MIDVYKYTHDVYNMNPSPLPLEQGSITRGHSFKLAKRRTERSTRQKFFPFRVVNMWNSLPVNVVEAPSVNSFKNKLDKHWCDKMYNCPKI